MTFATAGRVESGEAHVPGRAGRRLLAPVDLRTMRSLATSGVISALIVCLAAVPFTGWTIPFAWLVPMIALAVAEQAWPARWPGARADAWWSELNPFAWLSSAGYACAAFYLVLFHKSAAQTLGVTLYGVLIFRILARDYQAPRRLVANLSAPLISVALVQVAAGAAFVQRGTPWQVVTLVASPFIVFRAFRTMQRNLVGANAQEREARAQLSASETRYRLLAERSPDIILRCDTAARIEYLSPAAANYGYDPAQLIGLDVRDLLDPADWPRQDALLQELVMGRSTKPGAPAVWRARRADGTPIIFEGAFSRLVDDDGQVVGAMAVLRDVTAREALEDELRRRQADAEAATVAKSQFLANMSHEIRTPLTGVIGFAGLLKDVPRLPKEARRYADRIYTSAGALLTVVNDVLDFSKLEADQVELDPQPLDLRTFLEETLDLVRDQAASKGLGVKLDIDPSELPERIVADGARLRQVLLNLLTNAVKFTEAGQVSLAADAADGTLRITVRDTGIGVAPDVADRLFVRFSQVDGSNARQHGGTGLGLAISKGLTEMMGGRIGMESQPGIGSAFWIVLPLTLAPAVETGPSASAGDEVDVGATRVLVVDDVAVNRELVSAMLAPFEVEIVEACNGATAVQAALAQAFDVILMDLQMPGMDGLAATAAIRATSDLNRDTPILALSANVLGDHVAACLAAGMNDHIGKPISPGELLTKIARWTAPAAA